MFNIFKPWVNISILKDLLQIKKEKYKANRPMEKKMNKGYKWAFHGRGNPIGQ